MPLTLTYRVVACDHPASVRSAELNHDRERLALLLAHDGLHHARWCVQIPGALEEVLDKSSVDLGALPDGRLQVVAEDTVDVSNVVFLPHEQEEGVAVLANGGAEVHQPLVHVLVVRLHLGDLNRLPVGLGQHLVLFGTLLRRQVQNLHSDLDARVLGGLLQHGPNPVGTEQNALFRGHGRAVEGVRDAEVDALGDVGHQEDLLGGSSRYSRLLCLASSGGLVEVCAYLCEHLRARTELVLWVLEKEVLLGPGRSRHDAVVEQRDEIVGFGDGGPPQRGEDARPGGWVPLRRGRTLVAALEAGQEVGVEERVGLAMGLTHGGRS